MQLSAWRVASGVVFLGLGLTASALGQASFGYHPEAPVALGSIMQGSDPFSVRAAVSFNAEGIRRVDGGIGDGPVSMEFELREVRSRQELEESLGFDIQVSARYMVASGSTAFSFLDKFDFRQDSLVFIVKASADFGRYRIADCQWPKLTRRLSDGTTQQVELSAATPGDLKAWTEHYGANVVTAVHKKAEIVLIYRLEGMTAETKRQLSGAIQGAGQVGAGEFTLSSAVGALKKEAKEK